MSTSQQSADSNDQAGGFPGLTRGESMHARLRRATEQQHRALDHGLRYVIGKELSRQRYGKLLAALYGFYVPLEARIAHLQTVHAPTDVPLARRRSGLLEHDLRALGIPPGTVPTCATPRLTTIDHLAGALYVVEGACLGGQVIAHAVKRHLGMGPETGTAFFSGDGAHTAARWKRVLAWLDARERAAAAGDEMIEGACRTFATLWHWLSEQEVLDE
jgi:heme oxygenase (biliverdin-IX-beta and delta-forming)